MIRLHARLNYILKGFALFSAGVIGLVLALYLFLKTAPGKALLVTCLEKACTTKDFHLKLGSLEGNFPSDLTLSEIIIEKEGQALFAATHLKLKWHPFALFKKEIKIDYLAADKITLLPFPQTLSSPSPAPTFSLPTFPFNLSLKTAEIQNLSLISKQRRAFDFSVKLEGNYSSKQESFLNLKVSSLEVPVQSSLNFKVTYHPNTSSFKYSLKGEEEKSRLLAHFMPLFQDRKITLAGTGEGSLKNQSQGSLFFKASGLFENTLDFTSNARELNFKSTLLLQKDLPPHLLPFSLLENSTQLTGTLFLSEEEPSFTIKGTSPNWQLEMEGALNFKKQFLSTSLALRSLDLSLLTPLLSSPLKGKGTLKTTLQGPLESLSLEGEIKGKNLQIQDVSINSSQAKIHLENLNLWNPFKTAWTFYGEGDLIRVAGFSDHLKWQGIIENAPREEALLLKDFSIKDSSLTFHGQGDYILSSGNLKTTADFKIENASPLLNSLLSKGRFKGSFKSAVNIPSLKGNAHLVLKGENLHLNEPTLSHLVGTDPIMNVDLFIEGQMITLNKIDAHLENASLQGEGVYFLESGEGCYASKLSAPSLLKKTPLTATLKGSFQIRDTSFKTSPIFDFHVGRERLKGHFDFSSFKEHFELKNLFLKGLSADLRGNLVYKEGFFNGKVALKNYAPLNLNSFALPLSAQKLHATLKFKPQQKKQHLSLDLAAQDVAYEKDTLGSVALTTKLNLHDFAGTTQATLRNISSLSPTQVLALSLKSLGNKINFNLKAEDQVSQGLNFQANGVFSLTEGLYQTKLNPFKGRYRTLNFSLDNPLVFEGTPSSFTLQPLTASILGTPIFLEGSLKENALKGKMELKNLPLVALLEILPDFPFLGTFSFKALLSGTLKSPVFKATYEGKNLYNAETGLIDNATLNLQGETHFQNNTFKGTLALKTLRKDHLSVNYTLPFSLQDYRIPSNKSLEMRLKGETNLSNLSPIVLPEGNILGGLLATDLKISGSFSHPYASGFLKITEGSFENLDSGLHLKDLLLHLVAKGKTLRIEKGEATDGKKGHLHLEGALSLDRLLVSSSTKLPFYSLKVLLKKMHLIHMDEADITLSGNLELQDTPKNTLLKGHLVADDCTIFLNESLANTPTLLNVEKINFPEAQHEAPIPQEAPFMLDLSFSLPNTLHVTGLGLTTLWKGALKAEGLLTSPKLSGTINLSKGDFIFAGKTLLLKEGRLTFEGKEDFDPAVLIIGTITNAGITCFARLTGHLSNPNLDFDSTPPLPKGDIISYILFGKSTGQVGGVQALFLAEALASFSEGKSSLNVISTLRNNLGVDTIQVEQTPNVEDERQPETSISVGKYVTENVYVSFKKGVTSDQTATAVEVEVTPTITLETEVGTNAQSGVGVKWHYSY